MAAGGGSASSWPSAGAGLGLLMWSQVWACWLPSPLLREALCMRSSALMNTPLSTSGNPSRVAISVAGTGATSIHRILTDLMGPACVQDNWATCTPPDWRALHSLWAGGQPWWGSQR